MTRQQNPKKSPLAGGDQRVVELLERIARRIPTREQQSAWVEIQAADRRRGRAERYVHWADWGALGLTVAATLAGLFWAQRIFEQGEELTRPSPVVVAPTMQFVSNVTTDGGPRVEPVGTVLRIRVVNTGRVDAEVAVVDVPGADGLFFTESSCGDPWTDEKGRHVTGRPFVVEAGRSVAVVAFVPSSTILADVRLELADGRQVRAKDGRYPDTTEGVDAAYQPAFTRIIDRCHVGRTSG